MTDDSEAFRYLPLDPVAALTEPAKRLPFDLSALSVTGLVIICELDDPPPGNSVPTLSMSMTQHLRMSDGSMIRLDMDRGMDTFRFGYTEPLSWKEPAENVIAEVLTLIKGDEPDPESFPWDEYAEAAALRGITIDATTLRDLPYTVLISDELTRIFEF